MSGERQAPAAYFGSLTGGMLYWGCERQALPMVVTPTALLGWIAVWAFTQGAWRAGLVLAAATAVVLVGGLVLLRRMAKADPLMVRVYRRYGRYRGHYPARRRA